MLRVIQVPRDWSKRNSRKNLYLNSQIASEPMGQSGHQELESMDVLEGDTGTANHSAKRIFCNDNL